MNRKPKPSRKALVASVAFQAPAPAGSSSDLCAGCSSKQYRRRAGSPLYRCEPYCTTTARYCADERFDPAGKCGLGGKLHTTRNPQ